MSAPPPPVPIPEPLVPDRPVAAVIVLAAGGGTRMKSRRSKLLHEIGGRPLVDYAVDAAAGLAPQQLVVVVGHSRAQVEEHLASRPAGAPKVRTVVQAEQRGTGHAVSVALAALGKLSGEVVVTLGDVPLLTSATLAELVASHRATGSGLTVLAATVPDPTGYGRIVRDPVGGSVRKIVEERDATAAERALTEVNSGIYCFDAAVLTAGLSELTPDNAQGELYLTDLVEIANRRGHAVGAYPLTDVWQAEGVNDRVQLARLHAELNRRTLGMWMRAGVTVLDPASTWVQTTVDLAPDVTLLPGTSLEGATSVAGDATIGPDSTLVDCEVGTGATVIRTHATLAVIGADASVGPFAYLRPGTVLGEGGRIGTFVETKNAQIAPGAKVPHLSYTGDAVIGEGANIGAGVIFANYDGVHKAVSTVGAYSFVGSDSVLAAPVHIADGAYVAGGSVITQDVGPGELAVARGRQRNIEGWVLRKRAGTKLAQAAEAALDKVSDGSSAEDDPLVGSERVTEEDRP